MRTGDNRAVFFNSKVASERIINLSAKPQRRIDLEIGIGYTSNLETARNAIQAVLQAEERILPEPVPIIVVGRLDDSAVTLFVRPWVRTPDYWEFFGLSTARSNLHSMLRALKFLFRSAPCTSLLLPWRLRRHDRISHQTLWKLGMSSIVATRKSSNGLNPPRQQAIHRRTQMRGLPLPAESVK